MDFEDEGGPFANLPRYPAPRPDEPAAWMDTAAENLAHAGAKLGLWLLLAVAAGTLAYGLIVVLGHCGCFCNLSLPVVAVGVIGFGRSTWRR